MKLASAATTLAVAAILACHGAVATTSATASATDSAVTTVAVPSPQEALQAVKSADLPAGVTLSGSVEPISAPPAAAVNADKKNSPAAEAAADGTGVAHGGAAGADKHQEWFGNSLWGGVGGWGGVGIGGWGGWGGWGGFGPYRFGFNCGGIGGWAYPLGYWNAFGAGLYGGGCGLGIPFGGLYYC